MTTKTKFTPGRWYVHKGNSGNLYVLSGAPVEKATIIWSQTTALDIKANAALIAAAPELYEACCGIMEYYEAYNSITDKRIEPYIREVKVALAKANGGAQ